MIDFPKSTAFGLVSRISGIILIFGLVCWILTGIYTVDQGEVAVLFQFGRVVDKRVPAGIHYALPYPFHTHKKVSLTRMTTIEIGLNDRAGWITGDLNIIEAALLTTYRIRDPENFLFSTRDPARLVEKTVTAALNTALTTTPVDQALTTGKSEIEKRVKQLSQDFLTESKAGVLILSTHLRRAIPPEQVAGGFKEVMNARADKLRMVNEAGTIAHTKLSRARTEGFELISQARAQAETRVKTAEGKAQAIMQMIESPEGAAYTQRLYLETLAAILPRMKKIIVPPEAEERIMTIK